MLGGSKTIVNLNQQEALTLQSHTKTIATIWSLIYINVMLVLVVRLIIDGDIEGNQALLMLLKRQSMAHITRVINGLVIQLVSNLHVLLCIHFAIHKSEK